MSRKRQMIEVAAPAVMREWRPERFRLTGFTCPECQGNGWFWREDTEDPWSHGHVKMDCPVCGGTGEVECEVTVRWGSCRAGSVGNGRKEGAA